MFEKFRIRYEVQPCLLARLRTGLKGYNHEGYIDSQRSSKNLCAPSWALC